MPILDIVEVVKKEVFSGLSNVTKSPAIPCLDAVPDPIPKKCVVVRRAAGRRLNLLQDLAGIDIEVWAESRKECQALAYKISDIMCRLDMRGFAAGVEKATEESSYYDPDPRTKPPHPRYFLSYSITTHKN